MDLKQSAREWILGNLPYDHSDADLDQYLNDQDTHKLLVIYHNWTNRLIHPQNRRVHCSKALEQNHLKGQFESPLAKIISDIKDGMDLTRYLSRGVKVVTEKPVQNSGLQQRCVLDHLLNHWGIHHLHLSTNAQTDGFVRRTGKLLFALFQQSDAYLIDIMPHGSWSKRHLLEVLVREFPDSGCSKIMKEASGLRHKYSEEDVKALRNKGCNALFEIDGKVIMPAGGIVSSGTTLIATRDAYKLLDALEKFEASWKYDQSEFREKLTADGLLLPEKPEFSFTIHPSHGAGIFERNSRILLPLKC